MLRMAQMAQQHEFSQGSSLSSHWVPSPAHLPTGEPSSPAMPRRLPSCTPSSPPVMAARMPTAVASDGDVHSVLSYHVPCCSPVPVHLRRSPLGVLQSKLTTPAYLGGGQTSVFLALTSSPPCHTMGRYGTSDTITYVLSLVVSCSEHSA